MTLSPQELFASGASRGTEPRAYPREDGIRPGTLAAVSGAPALSKLTPLSFNETTGFWNVWSAAIAAGVNEVQTYDLKDPTGGTFTITFDGQTTSALAHNASNATVLAALEALSNIAPGDVALSAGPGSTDPVVMTFGGAYAGINVPEISLGVGSLTGQASAPTVSTTLQGAPAAGVGNVEGFLWEDDFSASATLEKQINIFRAGLVHYADIVLPSGEDADDLKAALRSGAREKGLDIQGLSGVH